MPTISIDAKAVAALAPADTPKIYYDVTLKGFGVRVWPNGSKVYVIEYRPEGGGRTIAKKRLKLGTDSEAFRADAARKKAKVELAKVTLGGDPAAERQAHRAADTVEQVIDAYLETIRKTRKPRTAAQFDAYARRIKPLIGSRKAVSLTRSDVAKLHLAIGEDHPVTANRIVSFIRSAYAFGIRRELLPENQRNPARLIDQFPEAGRERYLNAEELARLGDTLTLAGTIGLPWEPKPGRKVKHAPKAKNRRVVTDAYALAAIRLLLFTGARLREILHLEWKHVDLERGLLHLPDSKTGKKTIVLGAPAIDVIKGLDRRGKFVVAGHGPRKKSEREKVKLGDRPRSDLNRPWIRIREHAGLGDLRLHDLRHSFASVGASAGLGLPIIGKLLGHAETRTTQRYAHLANDPLKRAADGISAAIEAALARRLPELSEGDEGVAA